MQGYDDRLQALMTRCAGRDHLTATLQSLRAQRNDLERKVWALSSQCIDEQADVDRLEEKSIRNVLLSLLSRQKDSLGQARAELAAAILKHDTAKKELRALDDLIGEKQGELNDIERAQEEYDRLLREKAEHIDAQGGPAAEEIRLLREKIAGLEAKERELDEAIRVGRTARGLAEDVMKSAETAGGWAKADVFSDSAVSDFAKFAALEQTKERLEIMQIEIRRFQAELADVALNVDATLSVDRAYRAEEYINASREQMSRRGGIGGLFLATDFYIDDIFTGLSTVNRAGGARTMAYEAQKQIDKILDQLEVRMTAIRRELTEARYALKSAILNTKA